MEAIAKTRHLKGSPRKARLVIDLIRGRNVSQALNILKFTDKRAADPIAKTLRSAIANATNLAEQQNIAIDPDDLFVKTCFVDMGAHKNRRRMRPAPQGRAFREQRHYCHITILVSSDVPQAKDEDVLRKKGKKLLAKEAQGAEQKAKTPTKPKAEKKTAKAEQVKEEKKTAAAEIPAAKVKETKKAKAEEAKIDEVIEAKTPVVQEQVITETAKIEEPKVEKPEETTPIEELPADETAETEVAPVETAEVEEARVEEPEIEKAGEAKAETVEKPKADKTVEAKTTESETSDLLETESPKETKDSKAAKDDAKADAKISDAKNVVSQTPAERNETKKADDAQLDDNDILELQ